MGSFLFVFFFLLYSLEILQYISQYSKEQPLFRLSTWETSLSMLCMKIWWEIRKNTSFAFLFSVSGPYKQRFAGCGGMQPSLNIHPIQNWRSRSNTEEVLGNAYPPFHSQSKNIPVTCLNIQRKGIFCRSTFQVWFTLWNGLWECPSSWPNQDFRACKHRGFA